ncbi:MAG: winged helix-turn-helix transcriptional regulator [Lentisphaeria bacterium]|nr:winged helix-turn-helix transcriptional regulator [Lentisphaeria bacterium]
MPKHNDETELDLSDTGQQAKVWKALANPVRIELLRFLHNGPCCVTLSSLRLGISQPNLSKHLLILKEAGLVGCRGKGTQHCYFICRPSLIGPLLELTERKHGYRPCCKPEQRQ